MFTNKLLKFNVKKPPKNCLTYTGMYNFTLNLFGCSEWVVSRKSWPDLVNANNLVFSKNSIICKRFLGFGCIKAQSFVVLPSLSWSRRSPLCVSNFESMFKFPLRAATCTGVAPESLFLYRKFNIIIIIWILSGKCILNKTVNS